MLDNLKKGLILGAGIAALTKEKIEEAISEFVNSKELTEKEGEELISILSKKIDESKTELEKLISKQVEKTAKALNLVTKSELKILKKQIAELETKIEKLKAQ